MAYIRHFGGTKSKILNTLAIKIWNFCFQHHLTLTTLYVPSAHNPVDSPSRAMTIQNEWKLLCTSNLSTFGPTLGPSPHRPFHFGNQSPDQALCELATSPPSIMDECLQQALENDTGSLISSPPLESYSTMFTTLDSESTTCNTNNTKLAVSTLVPTRYSASTTTTNSNQHPSKRERSVEQEPNMDLISMEPRHKTMKSASGAAIAITNKTKNINP
ncbi:hypothetical protein INT45_009812 [Circinella minor]|uniref:Uncharacterized protein n=1 Tax=Circinella minor TaxID=1195481 RepID=A0A8H7VPL3_9FUNG|nr:hypothetical protein INT45_009812 [Circinella minor]